jgi:hypothetical protein
VPCLNRFLSSARCLAFPPPGNESLYFVYEVRSTVTLVEQPSSSQESSTSTSTALRILSLFPPNPRWSFLSLDFTLFPPSLYVHAGNKYGRLSILIIPFFPLPPPDPLFLNLRTRHAPTNHSHLLKHLCHKSLPELLPILRLVAPVLCTGLPLHISTASRTFCSPSYPDDLHLIHLRSIEVPYSLWITK